MVVVVCIFELKVLHFTCFAICMGGRCLTSAKFNSSNIFHILSDWLKYFMAKNSFLIMLNDKKLCVKKTNAVSMYAMLISSHRSVQDGSTPVGNRSGDMVVIFSFCCFIAWKALGGPRNWCYLEAQYYVAPFSHFTLRLTCSTTVYNFEMWSNSVFLPPLLLTTQNCTQKNKLNFRKNALAVSDDGLSLGCQNIPVTDLAIYFILFNVG